MDSNLGYSNLYRWQNFNDQMPFLAPTLLFYLGLEQASMGFGRVKEGQNVTNNFSDTTKNVWKQKFKKSYLRRLWLAQNILENFMPRKNWGSNKHSLQLR